ncbi:MAG: peptidoglycan hydrolase FlgJ [Desulfonauticus sp.]|nr:peptidoglycan hydrolase FlgJ [Desulfonauticus sp.]
MKTDYFLKLGKIALEKATEKSVNIAHKQQKQRELKKLKEVAQDFEAIFLQKIWEQMRKTVPKEGYLHSKEEDMYLSLFDIELSKIMAKSGGIGLSELIFEQLKERVQHLNSSVAEVDKEAQNIDEQVDRLARKIVEQKQSPKGGIVAFPQSLAPDKRLGENFVWPVKGEISSSFGWRIDPFTGQKAWHSGIDIAVPKNTEVKACWSGKVIFAGEKAGYGKTVILKHKNGLISLYAHNSKLLVEEGQFVRFGQKIALSGSSGRSTGPHLHFELRKGELALDPLAWQNKEDNSLTA